MPSIFAGAKLDRPGVEAQYKEIWRAFLKCPVCSAYRHKHFDPALAHNWQACKKHAKCVMLVHEQHEMESIIQLEKEDKLSKSTFNDQVFETKERDVYWREEPPHEWQTCTDETHEHCLEYQEQKRRSIESIVQRIMKRELKYVGQQQFHHIRDMAKLYLTDKTQFINPKKEFKVKSKQLNIDTKALGTNKAILDILLPACLKVRLALERRTQ